MRHSNHARPGDARLLAMLASPLSSARCRLRQLRAAQRRRRGHRPRRRPVDHARIPISRSPSTADQIFNAHPRRASCRSRSNNAIGRRIRAPIIKQINAQIANWPLRHHPVPVERAVLRDALKLGRRRAARPATSRRTRSPALNILIAVRADQRPGARGPGRRPPGAGAGADRRVLDPLLWPLEQHSVAPIPRGPRRRPAAPSAAARRRSRADASEGPEATKP